MEAAGERVAQAEGSATVRRGDEPGVASRGSGPTAEAGAAVTAGGADVSAVTSGRSVSRIPEMPMEGTYSYDAVCIASVRRVMDVFGGKWAFLVLEQLHVGTMRFGDLRRTLGASTKSLTDTLRHLEAHGIIERRAYPTVPVTVEYSLTEKGRSFDSVLLAMKDWGRAWL